MNRVIARLFSGMLSLVHALVLILAVGSFFFDSVWTDAPALAEAPAGRALLILAGLVVYVLFAGMLSTVVAINDNLEELNRTLARRGGDREPAPRAPERREPEPREPVLTRARERRG